MPLPFRSIENGVTMCALVPIADGGGQRLAGQHVGAVELAGDDAVEQHLPVGLRLERDVEPFVLEEALLVGDGERRHVGELDEAELELVLLDVEHAGPRRQRTGEPAGKGGGHRHGAEHEAAAPDHELGFSGLRLSRLRRHGWKQKSRQLDLQDWSSSCTRIGGFAWGARHWTRDILFTRNRNLSCRRRASSPAQDKATSFQWLVRTAWNRCGGRRGDRLGHSRSWLPNHCAVHFRQQRLSRAPAPSANAHRRRAGRDRKSARRRSRPARASACRCVVPTGVGTVQRALDLGVGARHRHAERLRAAR